MSFLENGGAVKRAPLDHLAAFASDADVDEYGRLAATPFCFITGSGHQYFLDTVRRDDVISTATRKERSRSLPTTLRTNSLLARAVSQEIILSALTMTPRIGPGVVSEPTKLPNLDGTAGRTRNRLVDGLSAPSHYAAAFSSPSPTSAGRMSFHTAAARCHFRSGAHQLRWAGLA